MILYSHWIYFSTLSTLILLWGSKMNLFFKFGIKKKKKKGFFDQLQATQNSEGLSGSQEDFQMLVVNLLGSLLKDFPATKSAAIQYGLIDTMADFIKWPEKLISNNLYV
jgi:hypothetical protein